ncbi:hypothetical protein ACKLNO_01235 [Neisseriaceae bacterium B1]
MNKIMQKVKGFNTNEAILKATVATSLIAVATGANAAASLEDIGTKVADAISGMIVLVSAIGMASITVIVAVQGIKLAWSMIKTVK